MDAFDHDKQYSALSQDSLLVEVKQPVLDSNLSRTLNVTINFT
jgi:hypothetical protein